MYYILCSLFFVIMIFATVHDAQRHPALAMTTTDPSLILVNDQANTDEFLQRLVGLTTRNGGMQRILAEIALTPPEWEQGLMGRTELADDAGMLFDFGVERPVAMWMKDTPLSLDMLFIADDGRVVAIARDTVPFSEAVIAAPRPVRYVLEVRGGQSAVWGVEPGSRLVQIAR